MAIPGRAQKSKRWRLRAGERRTLLVIGDCAMASIAVFLGLYFWASGEKLLGFSAKFLSQRVPGWFYLLPFLWVILMVGLYDIHRASHLGYTVRGLPQQP